MGGIASTGTPTLFVWCRRTRPLLHATRHQAPSREIISGCKETQSARLNALVLESNSVTTMAESERPVVRTMRNPLRWRPPPFLLLLLLSRPLFFCPSQTSWRRTNTGPIVLRLASERCRTLRAFIVMQILTAPDLQMDFYLFTPLWVFFFSPPLSRTIRCLLESSSEHGRGW